MKFLFIFLATLFTVSSASNAQQDWMCLHNLCIEQVDPGNLPGNVGPGKIILTLPDFPNCSLLVEYRMWMCFENGPTQYKIRITGWTPVDINDPACFGLKAWMYPSGYPGPVNDQFVIDIFNRLISPVGKYIYLNSSGVDPQYPQYHCPYGWFTQDFYQSSCVKLVEVPFSFPPFSIQNMFRLVQCGQICCFTRVVHCYNPETQTYHTTVYPPQGGSSSCNGVGDCGTWGSELEGGVVLSPECRPTCP